MSVVTAEPPYLWGVGVNSCSYSYELNPDKDVKITVFIENTWDDSEVQGSIAVCFKDSSGEFIRNDNNYILNFCTSDDVFNVPAGWTVDRRVNLALWTYDWDEGSYTMQIRFLDINEDTWDAAEYDVYIGEIPDPPDPPKTDGGDGGTTTTSEPEAESNATLIDMVVALSCCCFLPTVLLIGLIVLAVIVIRMIKRK